MDRQTRNSIPSFTDERHNKIEFKTHVTIQIYSTSGGEVKKYFSRYHGYAGIGHNNYSSPLIAVPRCIPVRARHDVICTARHDVMMHTCMGV